MTRATSCSRWLGFGLPRVKRGGDRLTAVDERKVRRWKDWMPSMMNVRLASSLGSLLCPRRVVHSSLAATTASGSASPTSLYLLPYIHSCHGGLGCCCPSAMPAMVVRCATAQPIWGRRRS
uniref:Uncharacterized protein n=1 Tax=Arundo donax TaxID=35708 RepID=A0A0A9AHD3_ARUDO